MKHNKHHIPAIFILAILLITNIYLYFLYKSATHKNRYHLTELCELKTLHSFKDAFLNKLDPIRFEQLCSSDLKCTKTGDEPSGTFRVYPVPDCPKSRREYCGFFFTFESDRLTKITSGYPCH